LRYDSRHGFTFRTSNTATMTHPHRSGWLALAALVIAVVVGAAIWQRSGDRLDAPAAGGLERDRLRLDAALDIDAGLASGRPGMPLDGRIEASAPFDPVRVMTPLVSDDMAVLDLLELLGPRARGGDPVAACELGRALGQCRMQAMMRMSSLPPPQLDVDHPDLDRYVDREASRQEWAERLTQRCDGIGRDALTEAATFTAQAAINGHLPSLLDFLHAPMMSAGDFIRSPALIDAYRTQLWPLLRRAFAEGHGPIARAAMMQLALPHVASPLSGVVPAEYQDPEAAQALLLMLSASDGRPQAMLPMGHSEPSEQAVASAQRWIDELFGGHLPSQRDAMSPVSGPRSASTCREPDSWLRPRS
jgi:hypothetical protein